jgi:hypothetical protein
MSESKAPWIGHTPAPWIASYRRSEIAILNGNGPEYIATIPGSISDEICGSESELRANAILIAAAPAMAAIIERLAAFEEHWGTTDSGFDYLAHTDILLDLVEQARALVKGDK